EFGARSEFALKIVQRLEKNGLSLDQLNHQAAAHIAAELSNLPDFRNLSPAILQQATRLGPIGAFSRSGS
ncbi:MAG: hypothetical protein LBD15_00615, partial [Holosporales bacterium]|nr:hypothetical protein [Holosporales bacterium]